MSQMPFTTRPVPGSSNAGAWNPLRDTFSLLLDVGRIKLLDQVNGDEIRDYTDVRTTEGTTPAATVTPDNSQANTALGGFDGKTVGMFALGGLAVIIAVVVATR